MFLLSRPRSNQLTWKQDATRAAPNNLLPSVSSDADTLIALFEDKTISPHDLTALVGAHSTSRQFATSLKNFAEPQDSTPGVWDVKFYNETVQPSEVKGTFRFASDAVLAADPRTGDEWKLFIGDQDHWDEDFARAYVRLSVLGVNRINNLTECTKTLPNAQPTFAECPAGPIITQKKRAEKRDTLADRALISKWAKKGGCPAAA